MAGAVAVAVIVRVPVYSGVRVVVPTGVCMAAVVVLVSMRMALTVVLLGVRMALMVVLVGMRVVVAVAAVRILLILRMHTAPHSLQWLGSIPGLLWRLPDALWQQLGAATRPSNVRSNSEMPRKNHPLHQ
jgi:hypothetical protein